jgi:hypothetical protein
MSSIYYKVLKTLQIEHALKTKTHYGGKNGKRKVL